MEALEFREIANLINHSRTTEIVSKPRKRGLNWSLHSGSHRVHGSQYPFQVIYLGSACTQEQVDQARAAAMSGRVMDTPVVFAPSLVRRHRKHHDLFEGHAGVKGVWDTKSYLRSFINDELDLYREQLIKEKPEHYIQPRVRTPSGFVKKLPDPLESVLLARGEYEDDSTGILGVFG